MKIPCPVVQYQCAFIFSNRKDLLAHLRHSHGRNLHTLLCKINQCHSRASSIRNYEAHLSRYHSLELKQSALAVREFPLALNFTLDTENIAENYHHNLNFYEDQSTLFLQCESDNTVDLSIQSNIINKKQFIDRFVNFAFKTREKHTLPQSAYVEIINDIIELFTDFHSSIINTQSNCLSNDMLYLFDSNFLQDTWSTLQNKSVQKNYLKSQGYVETKTIFLNHSHSDSYQYISLIDTLQEYLKIDDVFQLLSESNVTSTPVGKLTDYTDGEIFQQHEIFAANKEIIRLHLYGDEVEVCNALGSSKVKHKLYCFYFFIGNMPNNLTSNLRHIHTALIVESPLIKKYGFCQVLKPLTDDLIKLQQAGISVKNQNLKAVLATISTDNLGAHELCGFRRCFSSGNVCRVCDCDYKDLRKLYREDDFCLRTANSYDEELNKAMTSSDIVTSWLVQRDCAFNVIPGFHVMRSFPQDIMHDILEGVIPLTLKTIISELKRSGIISIKDLNGLLQSFKYHKNDLKSKPRCLCPISADGSIKLSASENFCVFRILPFILPKTAFQLEAWKLYGKLSEIIDITFSPVIEIDWVEELKQLSEDFYKLSLKVNPDNIRPKFHYVLHYAMLIKQFGPLRKVWCMRFEGYHRRAKKIAIRLHNFVNIALTVSKRLQLLSYFEKSQADYLAKDKLKITYITKKNVETPPEMENFIQIK